jgi:hypothetical protein
MKTAFKILVITATLVSGASLAFCFDEDLIVKNCQELMRIAEQTNQDLKTVDTMLSVALDSGSMDRIRNYKLKKSAVKKQLESVMKALEIKGCVKAR